MKTFIKTGIAFSFRACGALSMLFLSIIVTRKTTPTEAGRFFYCLSLIIPVSTIARYGIDFSIVKIVGRKKDSFMNINYLYSSLRISTLFSCLAAFFIIIFSYPVAAYLIKDPAYSALLKIVALSLPFTSVINVYASYYQAENMAAASIFLRNIIQYILTGIIAFVYSLFFPLHTFLLMEIYLGISILISIALVYFVNREIFGKLFQLKKSIFKLNKYDGFLLKFSRSFFLITIYNTVLLYSVLIIAGFFLLNSEIAVLNVGFRAANVLNLILIAVNTVITPIFSRYHFEKNIRALNLYYIKTVKVLFVITTPILMGFVFFSKFVMGIFGKAYMPYTGILIVILVGQYINVITGPIAQLYMMTGKEAMYQRVQFYMTILSIVLTILGFYLLGMIGGAYAYALLLIIQNLFLFIRFFIVDYMENK
jgi:O-antigen/teichoic acid export membrane protein